MIDLTDDQREAAREMDNTIRHLRGTSPGVDLNICGVCGTEIGAGQLMCAACAIDTMPTTARTGPLPGNKNLRG